MKKKYKTGKFLIYFSVILLIAFFAILKILKQYKMTHSEFHMIESAANNHVFFQVGYLDRYPVIRSSKNNGITWENIKVKNFIDDIIPSSSEFDGLQNVGNTLLFTEVKTCIECDFSNKWLNIFYSHDNGKTWQKISSKYIHQGTTVHFENDTEGYLNIPISDSTDEKYYTKDGGKTWVQK